MRVLMLGWEFPPVISGGLGVACHGLTKALAAGGTDVLFVLPRVPDPSICSNVKLIDLKIEPELSASVNVVSEQSPDPVRSNGRRGNGTAFTGALSNPSPSPTHTSATGSDFTEIHSHGNADSQAPQQPEMTVDRQEVVGRPHVEFVRVDANLWPYRRPKAADLPPGVRMLAQPAPMTKSCCPNSNAVSSSQQHSPVCQDSLQISPSTGPETRSSDPVTYSAPASPVPANCTNGTTEPSGDDLFREIDRYAHLATHAVAGKSFDVIHAHDWITFPAAIAISEMTGKPFVAHVHSTEFDRSANHINQRIYDVERAGLDRAHMVIAVSHLTSKILMRHYSVPQEKISVVYNAVGDNGNTNSSRSRPTSIRSDEKKVLFLGRITIQKGPEYFLAAARKVLQVYSNVRFIMAGSGDMVTRSIQLAEEMGISDRVIFTGFLQGDAVEELFRSADMYVMPSVSEPFGIASLEAISYDVPVLVSKQSGVSEVLQHVLKVDFWDVEEMANKIVAVLRHPPLYTTLKTQAGYEVRRLSWKDSASRCREVYQTAVAMTSPDQSQL